jgi:hypothetical protein
MAQYEIACFDNSDENFTANPRVISRNLSRSAAIKELGAYRANQAEAPKSSNPEYQFRYIMRKQ